MQELWGVLGQEWGCVWNLWGPFCTKPVDSGNWVERCWPGTWCSCFLAFGSALMDTWLTLGWGLWCAFFGMLHRKALEKTIWNYGGTWESNPGPSIFQPRLQPSEPWCACVRIMGTKYYIQNKGIFWKKNTKRRAMFEWPIPIIPRSHLLHSWNKNTGK